jgi:cytochrome oxidase Cu insertion factor (SCO1/SenC/PrrC family)
VSPPARLTEAERAIAFSNPPPRVPRKAVIGIVAACLVLGFGGLVVDHFFGGASKVGLTATPGATSSSLAGPPGTTPDPGLASSIAAMMDLRAGSGRQAPAFSLLERPHRIVSLSALRGKVVVLWFFDSSCDDICSVAEREIARSIADLADDHVAGRVAVLAVNTDALDTSLASTARVERDMRSAGSAFALLTASLPVLDRVWKAYGVTVEAQAASGIVSHTDLVDFVDPRGALVAQATPFANETGQRRYSLPAATIRRFAFGVASEADHLVSQGG